MVHYLNESTGDVLLQNNGHFAIIVDGVTVYLGRHSINPDALPLGWVKLDIPAEDLELNDEAEAFLKVTGYKGERL